MLATVALVKLVFGFFESVAFARLLLVKMFCRGTRRSKRRNPDNDKRRDKKKEDAISKEAKNKRKSYR